MRIYYLYFLDKLDVVVLVRPFRGAGEAAAIAHAQSLCATHAIEVRDAERVVARVPKRAKPRQPARKTGAGLWRSQS